MRTIVVLVILGVLAVLGGTAFMYSGLYNVAATVPHLPLTTKILTIGMRESVQRHARDIEVPPLSDPAMVHRGFRQFEANCVPCHGAPGVRHSQVGEGLLPHAPELSHAVPNWTPGELFWITKFGLKMTGMPAWGPTHRDDEIWAMVAFLLRLPTIGPADYRAMARVEGLASDRSDDIDPGRLIAIAGPPAQSPAACIRCHGPQGAGGGEGAFPRLAGQHADYLLAALRAYARGERASGIMTPLAEVLADEEMRDIARHYAAAEDVPYPPRPEVDALTLQRGGALAAVGAPDQGVPACVACHGPAGANRQIAAPLLAGQFADYLALQLHLWKQDVRGGGPGAETMKAIAKNLTDEQIEAVALYYASIRPGDVRPETTALDPPAARP